MKSLAVRGGKFSIWPKIIEIESEDLHPYHIVDVVEQIRTHLKAAGITSSCGRMGLSLMQSNHVQFSIESESIVDAINFVTAAAKPPDSPYFDFHGFSYASWIPLLLGSPFHVTQHAMLFKTARTMRFVLPRSSAIGGLMDQ